MIELHCSNFRIITEIFRVPNILEFYGYYNSSVQYFLKYVKLAYKFQFGWLFKAARPLRLSFGSY